MKTLTEELWRACAELGLRIELGFKVAVPPLPEIPTIARIPDLGASSGMLIVTSYAEIHPVVQRLIAAGYGFSVLDQPKSNEQFDLESFKRMFRDWGWSGELGRKPRWME